MFYSSSSSINHRHRSSSNSNSNKGNHSSTLIDHTMNQDAGIILIQDAGQTKEEVHYHQFRENMHEKTRTEGPRTRGKDHNMDKATWQLDARKKTVLKKVIAEVCGY